MAANDDFLDDFFAECDEHLVAARQAIVELDESGRSKSLNSESIDTLFRSFHSIKGLSAMVGLPPAETVAHSLEDFLSALRKGEIDLSPQGVTALIDGVKAIDQILAAKQSHLPYPETEGLQARIATLAFSSRRVSGNRLWRFTFAPTSEVAARGISVNEVRRRFESIGAITAAEPQVLPGGQVVFLFTVRTDADSERFSDWRSDSITFEPLGTDPAEQIENDSPFVEHGERRGALSQVVRVELTRLDDLMRMVGELVITRARLEEQLDRLRQTNTEARLRPLSETTAAFERQIRELREGVTRMRLVPLQDVFRRVQFIVHDLTRDDSKSVLLNIQGSQTEVDKLIVDRILDPLLHLVRNAISHGLETREERLAAGKPPQGKLRIAASLSGDLVRIDVEDDGRGISMADVQAKAQATGVIGPDTVVDEMNLLDIICSPGLSTRDEADRASGRGMGMSAVNNSIAQLAGSLSLKTAANQGTHFVIHLPLSLSIAEAVVIEVAGQRFVIPQAAVQEVIDIDRKAVVRVGRQDMLAHRDVVFPMLRLAEVFRLPECGLETAKGLIVGEGRSAAILEVDRLVGLQEVVVRPLIDPLIRVAGINGATELGDGRVVLIVDASDILRGVRLAASPTQQHVSSRL